MSRCFRAVGFMLVCVMLTVAVYHCTTSSVEGTKTNLPANQVQGKISIASMKFARTGHAATLLGDGRVLVTGGATETAEIFDLRTGLWSAAPNLPGGARSNHAALLLPAGQVLIVGGNASLATSNSTLLFTPPAYDVAAGGTFNAGAVLGTAREQHTLTLLKSGKVLVVGGMQQGPNYLVSCELYDVATKTFSPTGALAQARADHTATLLKDGKVLACGGVGNAGPLSSCEIFDPATGVWSNAGSMSAARRGHSATILSDGKVFIAGGRTASATALSSAEIFNPSTNQWSNAPAMTSARWSHSAVLLPWGEVVLIGGFNGTDAVASVDIYSSVSNTIAAGTNILAARYTHTATMLPTGRVLITGGRSTGILYGAELLEFSGQNKPASISVPEISSAAATIAIGKTLTISGTNFRFPLENSSSNTQASPTIFPQIKLSRDGSAYYVAAYDVTDTQLKVDVPCALWPGDYLLQVVVHGVESAAKNLAIEDLCFCQGKSCQTTDLCIKNPVCDGQGNCGGTPYECPQPTDCQESVTCDGQGGCVTNNKENGLPCDDGDRCMKNTVCKYGQCVGEKYTCTPTSCQERSECDGQGGCLVEIKPNGTTCPAVGACASEASCVQGECKTCGASRYCNALGTCEACDDNEHCGVDCLSCPTGEFCATSDQEMRCVIEAKRLEYQGSGFGNFSCAIGGGGSVLQRQSLMTGWGMILLIFGGLWLRRQAARRKRADRNFFLLLVGALVGVGATQSASAQEYFSTERLLPAAGYHNLLSTNSSRTIGNQAWSAGLLFQHSQTPLRGVLDGSAEWDLINYRETLHLLAVYGIWHRVELGVDFPVVLWQNGEALPPQLAGFQGEQLEGNHMALGDLHLLPKVSLVDNSHEEGFGLAVVAPVTLPTGNQEQLLSGGTVGVELRLAADYRIGRGLIAANAGYYFSESQEALNIKTGRQPRFSIGGLVPVYKDTASIILEVLSAIDSPPADRDWQSSNFPTEALIAGRYLLTKNIVAQLGGAVGISNGVGTPAFRVLAGIGYTSAEEKKPKPAPQKVVAPSPPAPKPEPEPQIIVPEPVPQEFNLVRTTPADGSRQIAKETELVCEFSEVVDPATVEKAIIAIENDQQAKLDISVQKNIIRLRPKIGVWKEGASVVVTINSNLAALREKKDEISSPGQRRAKGQKPVDSDSEILSKTLASAPRVINFNIAMPRPTEPPKVVVSTEKLRINQPVYFDFNSEVIKEESYGMLDKVAQVIIAHQEIRLIEVSGHSDSIGGNKFNQALSEKRAAAVKNYLVKAGVEETRLQSQGYGRSEPVWNNATEAGRAKNRRVEFRILEKDGKKFTKKSERWQGDKIRELRSKAAKERAKPKKQEQETGTEKSKENSTLDDKKL